MSKKSIEPIVVKDPESHSADLLAANIARLKELFPEVVAEGKVDFAALQEILGKELETGEEFYRFTWAGKTQARREAHKPSTGTLRPCPEESVDWDHTKNLYIEGDNLEVLKLLQKSYGGKVKMIYIDPPYNTGKDFVYKDNYRDNLRNYKEQTGQVDSDGNTLSTNSDTDGRYHSNWLNMMYPRLRLARNLLREDGVIFISIDESECHSLKKVLDELFGLQSHRGSVVRATGQTTGQDGGGLGSSFDYLLVYTKDPNVDLGGIPLTKHDLKRFGNEDDRGKYAIDQMRKTGSNDKRSDRPNMYYSVTSPEGDEIFPVAPAGYESCWRFERKTYDRLVSEDIILWKKSKREDGDIWWPYVKYYLEGRTKRASPLWDDIEGNKKAARDTRDIMGGKVFDFPKPLEMLRRVVTIVPNNENKEMIALDFFSGSATTAHAVMQLNAEDGGQRQHIQVQLPEPTDAKSEAYKAGYKTIAEIGKERIRRAGKKIVSELEAEIKALKAKKQRSEEEEQELKDKQDYLAKLDIGFKVFKLDSSNIKAWDGDPENMQENLLSSAENVKPDRSEEDVLYEVLLKYGLDLTLPIEERTIAKHQVFNVGNGALFLCLAENITNQVAEGIGKWKEELNPETCRVIFRDNGFTDVEKTNAAQTLKRYGVTEVRSI